MSDLQLKSIMQRILRLHAEEEEIAADRREVYAEAKANGYDKTLLGRAIATIRKRDKHGEAAIAESDAIISLYVEAYDGTSRAHTHTRETEANLPEAATEPMPRREAIAPATPESDHVDRSASAQPHNAEGRPAIPSKAGDAGTGQAVCGTTDTVSAQPSEAGIGSAVRAGAPFSLPLAKPLRPHCLNREACGSYGSKHCHACEAAHAEAEEETHSSPDLILRSA